MGFNVPKSVTIFKTVNTRTPSEPPEQHKGFREDFCYSVYGMISPKKDVNQCPNQGARRLDNPRIGRSPTHSPSSEIKDSFHHPCSSEIKVSTITPRALSTLVWWKMSLLMAGGLEPDEL